MKTNYLRAIKFLIVSLCVATMLSACGWRLRGTLALPEGLNSAYVVNKARAIEINDVLEELLETNDVILSNSASNAQLIITLEAFDEKSRTATLDSSGRVGEYELTSELKYKIEDALGNTLIPSSEASVVRVYQYDENNVIASGSEQQLLQREMRQELAQQVLRRLRFIDFSASQSGDD